MSVHPYGAWPSPLSAADVYSSSTARGATMTAAGTRFWLEVRPDNAGRSTLVRDRGAGPEDLTPADHDVRTRFHEYGGGAYGVTEDLAVYVDFATQRVWRTDGRADPRPITPDADARVRFSCFRVDPARGLVWCLREDQRDAALEPVTSLVRLSLDGPNDDFGRVAVAGRERPVEGPELAADVDSPPDFVLDHQLSPDGSRLAWVSWNHPNMAWHGTWLRVARVAGDGTLSDELVVAGAEDESVEQPMWLSDDRLLFLSDRSGWSNFRLADLSGEQATVEVVTRDQVEYGRPRWVPDMASYDVLPDGRVATVRCVRGFTGLAVLDPSSGSVQDVPTGIPFVSEVHALDAGHVLVGTGLFSTPRQAVVVDLATGSAVPIGEVDRPDPGLVSEPEPVQWPVPGGATANGFLYRPANPDVTGPADTRPPLLVTIHGGPTAAAIPGFSKDRAYWTSRGYAVLDVNYGGSTGFGRAFRERLDGSWGVVDVQDILAGARHLAAAGEVDGERILTRGGSAGGFTTLALLCGSDDFRAGTSIFGIADIVALARDTHKLESRYPWRLLAPWPDGEQVYRDRSPINQLDGLRTPLLILQGADDRVVPANQAEMMADALRGQGLPVAVIVFEGEGHGFRRPENRIRALEAELSFYSQILGLPHPDGIEPVDVENL